MARKIPKVSEFLTVVVPAVICVLSVTMQTSRAQTANSSTVQVTTTLMPAATTDSSNTADMSSMPSTDGSSTGTVTSITEEITDTSTDAESPAGQTRADDNQPTTSSGEPTEQTGGVTGGTQAEMTAANGVTGANGMTGTNGMTAADGMTGANGMTTGSVIHCYTCETNMTSDADPCYAEQNNEQLKEMCGAGERCWTTRFMQDGMFVNLTRGCLVDECKDEHMAASDVMCEKMRDTERCTQCCEGDSCNLHMNSAGRDLSGYLSGVLLSVVAVAAFMYQ